MQGQWIGFFTANNGSSRICVINIETHNDMYVFYFYSLESDKNTPSNYAKFSLPRGHLEYKTRITRGDLTILDKRYFIVPSEFIDDSLTNLFPGYTLASYIDIKLEVEGEQLLVSVENDLGLSFSGPLQKKVTDSSTLNPETTSWEQFKQYVSSVNYRKVAFRGQSDTWPLRTSFHRTGRIDVINYAANDIPVIHRHLSGLMQHYLDLTDSQHYGAFYSLLQHHGYPTPLLDWSYSPYVAAFFAFYQITNSEIEKGEIGRKARIYIWEVESWKKDYSQFRDIYDSRLHLSVGEYINLNNPRSLPQQALTSLTNVYDIEGYLYTYGNGSNKYLKAFDIPIEQTKIIMRDLALMGITYGTLFPGLDGACHDLKKLNFPDE